MATVNDIPDSMLDEYNALTPEEQTRFLERLADFPGLKAQFAVLDQQEAAERSLAGAVVTLRQWANDARSTTVTSGNAVATLQVVVNRLGIFFDRFADLLVTQNKGE